MFAVDANFCFCSLLGVGLKVSELGAAIMYSNEEQRSKRRIKVHRDHLDRWNRPVIQRVEREP